jgi:mRNA-degrading endonuclease RelE of RelBE toxin-antitoxin system
MLGCDNCCKECNSHFKNLRPSISEYKVSKHLAKDLDNYQDAIQKILNCENVCFSELHKFEEKIDDLSIFRAKIDGIHIVYAVSKEKILFFLRAFRNFSMYEKFLEDKKEIKKMVEMMR